MNFENFQIQIWMLDTVRVEKVYEKNEVICLVSIWKLDKWLHFLHILYIISLPFSYTFPSWVMVLKLSKKVHFLQFYADLCKKSKSIKAIYIYASERSRYAFSVNGIVYYARKYCFGDIRVWSQRILLHFCWFNIFFEILIIDISWTVAQTPINHIIFWKSVMRSFSAYMQIALTDLVFFHLLFAL